MNFYSLEIIKPGVDQRNVISQYILNLFLSKKSYIMW